MVGALRLEALTRDEAMRLLGSVWIGRLVFTRLALPAIRPAEHLVENNEIIVRADRDTASAVTGSDAEPVVAYEADLVDVNDCQGWTVTVIGHARSVPAGEAAARYRQASRPWPSESCDNFIVVEADMVDGYRLNGDASPGGGVPAER